MRDFAASIPCRASSTISPRSACRRTTGGRGGRRGALPLELRQETSRARRPARRRTASSSKNASELVLHDARALDRLNAFEPAVQVEQPVSTCCFTCAFQLRRALGHELEELPVLGQAATCSVRRSRQHLPHLVEAAPECASTPSSASSPSPSSFRRGCTPGRSRGARCACTAGPRWRMALLTMRTASSRAVTFSQEGSAIVHVLGDLLRRRSRDVAMFRQVLRNAIFT